MTSASKRANEADALAALHTLEILDSEPEAEFDALVRVAATACGVSISLLTLIDADRQWFKANTGLPGIVETARENAFCAYAVLGSGVFEIPDTTQDPRFSESPLVEADPKIRFYAGAPLCLSSGEQIGTLCVLDRKPGRLSDAQRETLTDLASVAVQAIEGRLISRRGRATIREATRAAFVLQHTRDAVVGVTADGTIDLWNEAAERLFGRARDAAIGQPMTILVSERDRENQQSMFRRLLEDGHDRSYESTHIRKDGSSVEVAITFVPEVSICGQITHLTKFIRDIGEEKRAARELAISEYNLRLVVENIPSLTAYWNLDLTCRFANPAYRTWFGVDPAKLPGTHISALLGPKLYALNKSLLEAALRGEPQRFERAIPGPDGITRYADAHYVPDVHQGKVRGLLVQITDISERYRLSAALAEQHELLRVTLQSIGDAVITSDAKGFITWLNPVAERMTGWLSIEAQGRPLTQVFHIVNEETRLPTENPVARCLAAERVVGLANQTVLISRDGTEYGIEDSASPIRDQRGDVLGVVLVFHDVSQQRRMAGEMTHRATHDELTDLPNRTAFEIRLLRLLHESHQHRSEHSMLYLDLDQFKLVNDACGHAAGDQLLMQVSKLFAKAVRGRDTLARLGGDEFGILLEHCTVTEAQVVGQKICDLMEDFRFIHDNRRFRIGASIGLVPVDHRWSSTAAIHQAADASCYAAKEAGRNRIHTWFDTDIAIRERSSEAHWATRIESALDDDGMVLFAQRIAPLTGDVGGLHAEVLVRMKNEDGTLTSAGAFLPAAERFSLVSRLDRWVLRNVISWLSIPARLSSIASLNVNLSGQSVGDRAFHAWANKVLTEAGPEIRSKICLEITETVAITNMADATLFIQQVRSAGVRVALDDFGAGASTFGYLKSLPVDYLKIDGQFVRDLVTDPLDEAAVRCFADVARLVGVQTVAEFVESAEILSRIKEIGIDFAQGFFLHRPQPIEYLLNPQPTDAATLPKGQGLV